MSSFVLFGVVLQQVKADTNKLRKAPLKLAESIESVLMLDFISI